MAFDQARYDELVSKGFSRVAAAVVCGAETTQDPPRIDETGSTVVQVHVKLPRVIADRAETDQCEALTPGCCIDHSKDPYDSCDTW